MPLALVRTGLTIPIRLDCREQAALSCFPPSVAKVVLQDYVRRPEAANGNGGLTTREGEILRLLAQGHTNREIAESLCLSVKTVEKHRANIVNKLGLRTRSGLVLQ